MIDHGHVWNHMTVDQHGIAYWFWPRHLRDQVTRLREINNLGHIKPCAWTAAGPKSPGLTRGDPWTKKTPWLGQTRELRLGRCWPLRPLGRVRGSPTLFYHIPPASPSWHGRERPW